MILKKIIEKTEQVELEINDFPAFFKKEGSFFKVISEDATIKVYSFSDYHSVTVSNTETFISYISRSEECTEEEFNHEFEQALNNITQPQTEKQLA
jgi:hypothetical protein